MPCTRDQKRPLISPSRDGRDAHRVRNHERDERQLRSSGSCKQGVSADRGSS